MKIFKIAVIFTTIFLAGCTYYSVHGNTNGNIRQERKGAKTDTDAQMIPGVD